MNPFADLPGLQPERAALARNWLKLAVLALLGSGVYSLLLILAQTPGIRDLPSLADLFQIALVVHLDLSLVIWSLAFAGVLWSLIAEVPPWLNRAALWFMGGGTLIIAVAPLLGAGNPVLSNYVPVLQHPVFTLGGVMVLLGVGLLILSALFARSPDQLDEQDRLRIWRAGGFVAALIGALALNALLSSYISTPRNLPPEAYFEFLFWGPGHLLQFSLSLLLLVAWGWLLQAAGHELPIRTRSGVILLVLAGLPALAAPALYFVFDVVSIAHKASFTLLTKYGGLLLLPFGLVVVQALLLGEKQIQRGQAADAALARTALWSSLLLFLAAGIITFLIHGVNAVIPAHYHGSTIGATLAFMGVAYLLLPRLGFERPWQRIALWQPWVYGGGQLLHILGLAITDGYGNLQPKTAAAAQHLDGTLEILGMGLMGLGGLIAIIGGLMFVVVMLKAIWLRRR
jgi:hypothetical protein